MKILIRTPNWLGDVLLSLPAIGAVRRGFPAAEIVLAVPASLAGLFSEKAGDPPVISLGPARRGRDLRAAARDLRSRRFDAVLLLTNSFGTALQAYLAGIPERWGYRRDGRSLLLTKGPRPVRRRGPAHMVGYYLDLVAGLGLAAADPEIRLALTDAERDAARRELAALGADPGRPLVVLSPGAAYGPAKRWPAERFAAAGRILQERHGAEIAITGSASEIALAEAVAAGLARPAALLAGRTSLRQLLAVLGSAAACVTNDSGPMHMANALRVPVVAAFGPTEPAATRPFHEPAVVLHKGAACAPCLYRGCPYDHRCMTAISAEEAAAAAAAFLP